MRRATGLSPAPTEAKSLYEGMRKRDPGREAGTWQSGTTGDVVVVQGEGDWVEGGVNPPKSPGRWVIIEHYHPERNFAVQFPSVPDYNALLPGHGGRGTGAIQSRIQSTIRYPNPKNGEWHFRDGRIRKDQQVHDRPDARQVLQTLPTLDD